MENFSGKAPRHIVRLTLPKAPRSLIRIGKLRAVIYDTVRDGKPETYIHRFKLQARPLFAASTDGRSLHIVGGRYDFTERGIVDHDD